MIERVGRKRNMLYCRLGITCWRSNCETYGFVDLIGTTLFKVNCFPFFGFCLQVELRADERILEEQKRQKELLARVEREAILQNENCQIKIRTIEIEAKALKEEVSCPPHSMMK